MKNRFFLLLLFTSASLFAQQIVIEPFKQVNSKYNEQNPIMGPGALFFTIANHPQNIGGKKDPGDIWISLWVNGAWTKPTHGGSTLNDAAYNAVAGFNADATQLYLLSHYGKNGTLATTQGIAVSKRGDDGWSVPENISIPYFLNRSTHFSGTINSQGTIFLFAAESYATLGAEDIYVSLKNGDKWSEPINLGASINTSLQEWTPSLSDDGWTIYFSSNGRKGEGGFDIYSATRLDSTWKSWSAPIAMEAPPNSEGRELYYRPSKGSALFTTTRNSDGYGDIRALVDTVQGKNVRNNFLQKKESVQVTGKVTNAKTGVGVKSEILYRTDSTYYVYSSDDGSFMVKIPSNRNYNIEVHAQGYVNLSEHINLQSFELTTLEMNFKLQPIAIGTVVTLKNILFYIGTTSLIEGSYPELNSVVGFLKDNPKIEIELEGHTDNRGDSKKNLVLSQQRVDVIKNYLVSKGISSKRIKGKGYGDTRPVSTDDSEEAHKLNRRVEFVIVKD